MIKEIPLSAEPSKIYKCILNDQECTLKLYQKGRNLFLDLQVGAEYICTGAVCLNLVPVVQVSSPNFSGNFVFADILGDTPPQYDGLNSRYFLVFYTDDEILPNVIKMAV